MRVSCLSRISRRVETSTCLSAPYHRDIHGGRISRRVETDWRAELLEETGDLYVESQEGLKRDIRAKDGYKLAWGG